MLFHWIFVPWIEKCNQTQVEPKIIFNGVSGEPNDGRRKQLVISDVLADEFVKAVAVVVPHVSLSDAVFLMRLVVRGSLRIVIGTQWIPSLGRWLFLVRLYGLCKTILLWWCGLGLGGCSKPRLFFLLSLLIMFPGFHYQPPPHLFQKSL